MMIRPAPLALLVAITLSGCVFNRLNVDVQKFLTVPAQDTIKVAPVDPDRYESRFGSYDGIYLLNERTLRYYGNYYTVRMAKTRRLRYVVLDPNAEWLSTASYEFKPNESLTLFYSIVTSPEGVSRLFTERDMVVDKGSDGTRRYRLAYPDVRRGTIIEEALQTDVASSTYAEPTNVTMLQYNIPADTVRFRLDYPEWWNLKVKKTDSVRPPLFQPPPASEGTENFASIVYETHEVPALSREPYSPYHKEEGLYFEGTFVDMSTQYRRFKAPASWTLVGNTILGEMMPEMPPREDIEDAAKAIVGEITDPRKKVDAIATWIQDSIRLVDRDEVDSRNILYERAGHGLAVTELAMAMLDAAGITSHLYFIHSADDGYFDQSFIEPQQFDIIACAAIVDDRPVIFFPYLRNMPIGYIPTPYRGQPALAIERVKETNFRKDRYSTHGIVQLEDDGLSANRTEDSLVATLTEEGDVIIDEHRVIRGGDAIEMRDELGSMSEEEKRRAMQELIGAAEGDITLESYEVTNLTNRNQPLDIRLRYRAGNALTITPEEVVFHTGGLLAPSTESHWTIDSTERKSPIAIYSEEHLSKNIRIVHPPEWRLQTTLADQQKSTRFGEVSSRSVRSDRELTVDLQSILRRSRGGRETIGELRQLVSAQSTLAVPTLVFSR